MKRPCKLLTGLALGWVLLTTACASQLSPATAAAAFPPARPYPDSRFVELGGATVHLRLVRPEGEARGRVLLLHGLAGSTWSWQALLPALQAAGYLALALDLPPFGFSSNQFGVFADAAAAAPVLADLLQETATGPWTVLGHSMGGRYAARLALAAPDLVEALILVDGAVAAGGNRLPGGLAGWFIRGYVRDTLSRPARLAAVLRGAFGQPPTDEAVLAYAAPFAQAGKIDALLDWARAGSAPAAGQTGTGRASQADDDGLGWLDSLRQPVLLVWGEKDSWVPLAAAGQLQRRLPQAELVVIAGAGHNPMETHPQPVNQAVLAFLDRLERPARAGLVNPTSPAGADQ